MEELTFEQMLAESFKTIHTGEVVEGTVIDVKPEVALKRLQNKDRSDKADRLDKESIEFHQRVYDGYIKLLEMYPDRIVRIDGNLDLETVSKNCVDAVLKYLGK